MTDSTTSTTQDSFDGPRTSNKFASHVAQFSFDQFTLSPVSTFTESQSSTGSTPIRTPKRQLDVPEQEYFGRPKSPRTDITQKHAARVHMNAPSRPYSPLHRVYSSTDDLCTKCQDIDFDKIFSMDIRDVGKGHGTVVSVLKHVDHRSGCRLCRFFAKMEPKIMRLKTQSWHLVAYSATRRFGIDHQRIKDEVLLAVQPTRSSSSLLKEKLMIQALPEIYERIGGKLLPRKIDFDSVRTWVRFCENNHTKHCKQNQTTPLPGLRVIDCENRRIVSARTMRGLTVTYLTLSYVWGGHEESECLADRLPDKTPLVIEDAIKVVMALGYRFLWIDRYCIAQGNAREKHRLIQNMGSIYKNSVLTIIAAAGKDPHHGLPGVSTTYRDAQAYINLGPRTYVYFSLQLIDAIHNSTWATRAWTYQEALLARRTLVFTQSQVYFQCSMMHCVESVYFPLKPLHTIDLQGFRSEIKIPRVFPSRGVGKWPSEISARIEEYSKRNLSFESDSFKAFQGILQAFRAMKYPVRNIHGLPIFAGDYFLKPGISDTDRLLVSLGWRIEGAAVRRKSLPSWTWAGWKLYEKSHWRLPGYDKPSKRFSDRRDGIKIEAAVEFPDGTSIPWQGVKVDRILLKAEIEQPPVHLRLRGWTMDVRLLKTVKGWRVKRPKACFAENQFATRLVAPEGLQLTPELWNKEFVGLIIGSGENYIAVLLLVETTPQLFERVGCFDLVWARSSTEWPIWSTDGSLVNRDSGLIDKLGLQLVERELLLG
jgi:hypothetical protein